MKLSDIVNAAGLSEGYSLEVSVGGNQELLLFGGPNAGKAIVESGTDKEIPADADIDVTITCLDAGVSEAKRRIIEAMRTAGRYAVRGNGGQNANGQVFGSNSFRAL